ncbi:hypothetical protein Y032_0537g3124 [Ancylostoma ceylanicum]|nr:hypothetical protein Y032_0537g3124 [Ancylostoma ceylanicum]
MSDVLAPCDLRHTVGVDGGDPSAVSRSTRRDSVARAGLLPRTSNNAVSLIVNPPLRRRFHRERRGRAACFPTPQTGHRHRRPLYCLMLTSR